MKARVDNNSNNAKTVSLWYQCAVATAIVGGVFSLIILTLIVINYFQMSIVLPKWEEKLEALKVEIRNKPDDQQLLLRIRQFDLQIRKYRIRGLDFSYKGSFLLFSSVAVLLVGAKWASTFKKKVPAPQLRTDSQDKQVRQAMWARWTVTAGLVILGSGALILSEMTDQKKFEIRNSKFEIPPKAVWPRFRGPGGLGISAYTNIPTNWNVKTGEGIAFKSKVPLPGHSSPVVWNDRVFLSGGDANSCEVFCFDASSGELLWQGDVPHVSQAGKEPFEVMADTGYAAPTVVTDGRRVCAIFATGDVGCFDFTGRRIWARSLGIPDSAYGYASSLTMYRNLLLIQYDQASAEEEKSRLIALDVFSGNAVWEMKRPVANSWTSPIVADISGGPQPQKRAAGNPGQYQLITVADPWVIAYDPAKGAEIWRAKCVSGDAAPSPIYAGGDPVLREPGLVFAIEPYAHLVAVKPDGRGDVTETHIAWRMEEGGPDICSPVSNGEVIFLLESEGLLSCHKVTDGTLVWQEDLRENFRASPSLVGDKLYLLSEEGVMFIIEVGAEYKELARCKLGEKCYASPAFADGRIYIRGLQNLYCIGGRD